MRNSVRDITLNLADLQPYLSGDKLTITVPVWQGPIFTEEAIKATLEVMGEHEGGVALDRAAEQLYKAQAGAYLVKRIQE